MNDNERVKQFLAEADFMVIAVTLDNGTAWAVPVKIQLQWGNAFEWDSKTDTEHAKVLKKRPEMMITAYEKTGDSQIGFYASGKAELVSENEKHTGRYRFIAEKCWINDQTFIKREVSLD